MPAHETLVMGKKLSGSQMMLLDHGQALYIFMVSIVSLSKADVRPTKSGENNPLRREGDGDSGTVAGCAFDFERTAMLVHQQTRDIKPKACAVLVAGNAGVGLTEGLKRFADAVSVHANAVIGHLYNIALFDVGGGFDEYGLPGI